MEAEGSSSDVPAAFGRFRVLQQIHPGSLGPLFRAEDGRDGRAVVIRLIQLNLSASAARDLSDALNGLERRLPEHPAVVPILATGLHEHWPFIVTPLVPGQPLDAAWRELGPATIVDALPRLEAIAAGLDAAADVWSWHGALSPSDILVATTGTAVLGIGIAPVMERVGVRLPVRPFSAPEVVEGQSTSPATDQYALAAIAQQWLYGRSPTGDLPHFKGAETPGVDAEALTQTFIKAMARDPSTRFESCSGFVRALAGTVYDAAAAAAPFAGTRDQDTPTLVPSAASHVTTASPLPKRPPIQFEDFEVDPELTTDASFDDLSAGPDRPLRQVPATEDRRNAVEQGASFELGEIEQAPPSFDRRGGTASDTPDWPLETERTSEPAEVLVAAPLQAEVQNAPASGRTRTAAVAAALLIGMALGAGVVALIDRNQAAAPLSEPLAIAESAPEGQTEGTRPRDYTDAAVPTASDAATGTEPTAAPAAARRPVDQEPAPPRAAEARTREGTSNTGRLLVHSQPEGADVVVDGEHRGVTPLALRDLRFGVHTIVLSHDGYRPVEQRIQLAPGRPSRTIEMALAADVPAAPVVRPRAAEPSAARTATTGGLLIESRPAGAVIFVNGRNMGTTPATLDALAPGGYEITLERDGYRSWSTIVRVSAGERTRVAASLAAEGVER